MKHLIKNKTKLIITLSALLGLTIMIILLITKFSNNKSDRLIAKVEKDKIYQSEIDDKISKMFENGKVKRPNISIESFPLSIIEGLSKDIYLEKQLDKIIAKSKLAKNQELQKQVDEYKKNLLRKAYIEEQTSKNINEQIIKDRYSQLSSQFSGKKEIHLKHILVKSEEEAKNIINLLNSGKKHNSFEQLAKKYSLDQSNANSGGDLGYIVADNLDEDFAKGLLNLEPKKFSSPIKTKSGWHIVLREDSRNIVLPSFEDLRNDIEAQLKQEEIDKIYDQITQNVKVKILIKLKSDQLPIKKEDSKNNNSSSNK